MEIKRVVGWVRVLCTSGRGSQMQHVVGFGFSHLEVFSPFTSLFTVFFFFFCPPVDEITEA